MEENKTLGKVIGFKVESDKPEDSPANLAKRMANYLQKEINSRADAREFREQAKRERQKAKQLANTLVLLTEYLRKKDKALKDGLDWKPSRMEPMETYDKDMIQGEKVMLINRARDLDDKAIEYEKEAENAKRHYTEAQQKLFAIK